MSNFRNLNKKLKRNSYPVPKINIMLLKLIFLKNYTSLDLNMGNDHIQLGEYSSNLCVILTPWRK